MEDPNLIATLIPADTEKLTENAFRLDDNEKHYLPPTQGIAEDPTISSRKATPAKEMLDDDHCKYDFTHCLQLIFDKEPKDPTKKYFFGTNPRDCDILLGQRGSRGINGLHFCIIFDDIIDEEKHFIFRGIHRPMERLSVTVAKQQRKCGIISPGFWT